MSGHRPFTARVLDRLPVPRWIGIVGWALLAPASYFVGHVADPLAPYPGDLFVVTFAWTGIIGLWAAEIVTKRLDELQPAIAQLAPSGVHAQSTFRPVGSATGPVIFTVVVTLAFEVADFLAAPSAVTGLRIAPVFIGQLAGLAYIWVFVAVLLGVDRLGRHSLQLAAIRADPGLGLRPIGRLAFVSLGMALIGVLPVMLSTIGDLRSMVVTLGLLFSSVALLFIAVYRLHRQLVTAKAQQLHWARELYDMALAPIEAQPDGDVLTRQAPSLAAAAELERRAGSIAEWPFDEWILRVIAAILVGATAGVVARAVGAGLSI